MDAPPTAFMHAGTTHPVTALLVPVWGVPEPIPHELVHPALPASNPGFVTKFWALALVVKKDRARRAKQTKRGVNVFMVAGVVLNRLQL